jgi:large subunit ribosomal protein L6
MSRIGKKPIDVPKGVEISVSGRTLTCKGPLGSLPLALFEGIEVSIEGGKALIKRAEDSKQMRAMHGTTRALLAGMIEGVTKGYRKSLEIVGVGYKAQMQGKRVALEVGFADTQYVDIPDGIKIEIPDPTHVHVSGINKQMVGQITADLRATRKPEPYKGKGVRYVNEIVRRKAGKAAAGTASGAK